MKNSVNLCKLVPWVSVSKKTESVSLSNYSVFSRSCLLALHARIKAP